MHVSSFAGPERETCGYREIVHVRGRTRHMDVSTALPTLIWRNIVDVLMIHNSEILCVKYGAGEKSLMHMRPLL